jgi:hypothetical protein
MVFSGMLQEPYGVKSQETPFFTVHSTSPILVTLMMELILSSETSVLTGATWSNSPEDGILHSHRRENLNSYIALSGWTL